MLHLFFLSLFAQLVLAAGSGWNALSFLSDGKAFLSVVVIAEPEINQDTWWFVVAASRSRICFAHHTTWDFEGQWSKSHMMAVC